MEEFVKSMTYPFLACLLLAGIHVYLGIHVISRKVIFVDLALAQIAAFGAVFGVVLGYGFEDDPWAIKGLSLGFAFVGAAVFSITRMRHERVPQEAIIGITYAVALAASILASAHLPHGADEMRTLLAGSILWVRKDTLLLTAILYGVIGAFHYAFRRRFLLISLDPERAEAEGIRIRLWDFLFYISFGFVVTSSVAIAGVLLVFSYLVIPAVVAVLFARGIGARLAIGWTVGTVVSFVGVTFSYQQDLPSGPTIVVTFAAFLMAAGVLYHLIHAPRLGRAIRDVVVGALVFAALGTTLVLLRKEHHRSPVELLRSSVKNERLMALKMAEGDPDVWESVRPSLPKILADPEAEVRSMALELLGRHGGAEHLPLVHGMLTDPDDLVREEAVRCLRDIDHPTSVEALLEAMGAEQDEYIRVEMAEATLEMGDARGIPTLIEVMDAGRVPQVREEAHDRLSVHTTVGLPFDADAPPEENDAEVAAFRRWWLETWGRLVWDGKSRRFEVR